MGRRVFLWLAAAMCGLAQGPVAEIRVDQAGYLLDGAKVALVAAQDAANEFTVRRTAL